MYRILYSNDKPSALRKAKAPNRSIKPPAALLPVGEIDGVDLARENVTPVKSAIWCVPDRRLRKTAAHVGYTLKTLRIHFRAESRPGRDRRKHKQ